MEQLKSSNSLLVDFNGESVMARGEAIFLVIVGPTTLMVKILGVDITFDLIV